MYAKRKLVDIGTLTTKVEDTNLWVRNTTVESRLGIGLEQVILSVNDFAPQMIELREWNRWQFKPTLFLQ